MEGRGRSDDERAIVRGSEGGLVRGDILIDEQYVITVRHWRLDEY